MQIKDFTSKQELKKRIAEDPTPRTTISFYRYVNIKDPEAMRDELFVAWSKLGVLGRIYVAREGVNAQLSVPTKNQGALREHLDSYQEFKDVPFKIAVEDDGKSFYKLTVKWRKKIVADGLDDDAFDTTNVGNHLTAEEWNNAMQDPDTVVVDMRNQYESEIGHFEGAVLPDVDTFREELQYVKESLKENKDKKILLYCTGGIRCEKASAFLKSEGFSDVNQLYGGVIDYARQIQAENRENKFKGKNFVFDERMGERISDDVIAHCHQCQALCDTHTNCANNACHLLFIQCNECKEKFDGTCSAECQRIAALPIEEQRSLRKNKPADKSPQGHRSRLRPNLLATSQISPA